MADTELTFLLTSDGHNAEIVSEPSHPHPSFQLATRPGRSDDRRRRKEAEAAAELLEPWCSTVPPSLLVWVGRRGDPRLQARKEAPCERSAPSGAPARLLSMPNVCLVAPVKLSPTADDQPLEPPTAAQETPTAIIVSSRRIVLRSCGAGDQLSNLSGLPMVAPAR